MGHTVPLHLRQEVFGFEVFHDHAGGAESHRVHAEPHGCRMVERRGRQVYGLRPDAIEVAKHLCQCVAGIDGGQFGWHENAFRVASSA